MQKFDLKEMRMGACLFLICLVLVLVVWNAFNYLPSEDTKKQPAVAVNIPDEENDYSENENYDNSDEDENSTEEYNSEENYNNSQEEYVQQEEMYNEQQSNESFENYDNENEFNNLFYEAENQMHNNDLTNAITTYKKASEVTNKKDQQANCFEQISIIYAVQKRYGTALAYAQKAYLAQPTPTRELLVAKLYYKTGDKEKANRKMEALLSKDFTIEN